MSDNDLSQFLADWPFEPARVNARLIEGRDGRMKVQVRVHLGVLQMELDGRPDGRRFDEHQFDSLLAKEESRLKRYDETSGGGAGFVLSADECRDLREEAMQLGQRMLALFVLEDYSRVERDCEQALRILDLLADFAAEEADRFVLQELRPHILTMRCRARASAAVRDGEGALALQIIDHGLDEVTQALGDLGAGDRIDQSNEIRVLRGMRDTLVPKLPASERDELRRRLMDAIAAENYELASILRDELRSLE